MKVLKTVQSRESRVESQARACGAPASGPRLSTVDPRLRSRGIALIITLVMLSVITFLAVTFLVMSQRQRGAVATTTDQAVARFAADTALERAKVELIAPMLANTNNQLYDLRVSTTYANTNGFDMVPVVPYNAFTNVNYDLALTGPGVRTGITNLAAPQRLQMQLQNLENLYYDPRPPVFVTNYSTTNMESRFYLDLNRNGLYDGNGFWPELSGNAANPYYLEGSTNGALTSSLGQARYQSFTGDPEWIGVLEHPEWPHSATNRFVYRYAFVAVPVGKTLDVNYIHNATLNPALNNLNDGFFRNEGVGTWEINLAAFLTDLNSNVWNTNFPSSAALYDYERSSGAPPTLTIPNKGLAFDDALSLLSYRYNFNYNTLGNGPALKGNGVDDYTVGQLMVSTNLPLENEPAVSSRWAGSDNTNHFFTTQEFFDRSKAGAVLDPPGVSFVDRLLRVGTNASTYDRYTFYRMLAQLGTDSAAEQGKININYRNLNNGVLDSDQARLLNYTDWAPEEFFTNAVDRMLQAYGLTNISSGRIPIYPTNYYTAVVHRVMQLAANIYDATIPPNPGGPTYPTIFRPLFMNEGGTNIIICGYQLVQGPYDGGQTPYISGNANLPLDMNELADWSQIGANPTFVNVYGAPWVIGARKGFPNLNEIISQSMTEITRKLQITKPGSAFKISEYTARQMFVMGISNLVGVEVWNSYRSNYTGASGKIYVQVDGRLMMSLTNETGYRLTTNMAVFGSATTTSWPGYIKNGKLNTNSFLVPLLTNAVVLPDSSYQQSPPAFVQVPASGIVNWNMNQSSDFTQPHWGLNITNRLRCFILDGGANGRVVDYVALNGLSTFRDLSGENDTNSTSLDATNMWSIQTGQSYWGTMPIGVINQLEVSLSNTPSIDADWYNNVQGMSAPGVKDAAIDGFRAFMGLSHATNTVGSNSPALAPFTPAVERFQTLTWQADDPLVHYTVDDLLWVQASNIVERVIPPGIPITGKDKAYSKFFQYTDRYDPWNGPPTKPGSANTPDAFDVTIKDPGMSESSRWDFPTNKFPNVGWLGRVHRGTPWQTVYMKGRDLGVTNYPFPLTNAVIWAQNPSYRSFAQTWANVSGNTNLLQGFYTRPIQDRVLFDIFTTAADANAAHGQLSVNQTNLAAWSAVLSGVTVLTNTPSGVLPLIIQPASVSPVLTRIVNGINNARTNAGLFPKHAFEHTGDVLAAPELTEKSPFVDVDLNDLETPNAGDASDEVMERIPQQVMSLLTVNARPRFVIYAYGQSLRPADNSVITAGPFQGLCTNYQVTAETAFRAVVRVDGSVVPGETNYPPRAVLEQFNGLPSD
jgi:hypothetical protein